MLCIYNIDGRYQETEKCKAIQLKQAFCVNVPTGVNATHVLTVWTKQFQLTNQACTLWKGYFMT